MPHNKYAFSLPCIAAILLMATCTAQAGDAVNFRTSDNVTVYGTLTKAQPDNDEILLLFHQANGNREEYTPIVPRLTKIGYDTLAIDQRAGGNLFAGRNKTVSENGQSAGYLDALPDLEAALDWAESHGYSTIVTVGSSYSASLVILLAAQHPQRIDALASFSPGEYFDDGDRVKNAAAKIDIPFYITTDPGEANNVAEVLRTASGDHITHYEPDAGVHGASTLVASRDPEGHAANLASFTRFLKQVPE